MPQEGTAGHHRSGRFFGKSQATCGHNGRHRRRKYARRDLGPGLRSSAGLLGIGGKALTSADVHAIQKGGAG